MSRQVVGLNPVVLTWARVRAGLSIDDVAITMKKDPDAIESWEDGSSAPTYVQLEKLAYTIFKRPIAIFFFPEPPDEPDPTGSFRTLPDFEIENLSPHTRFMLRKARSLQLSLYELSGGENPSAKRIFEAMRFRPNVNVAHAAGSVREFLGIPLETQQRWRDARSAFEKWRSGLESVGVFVFKDAFKQTEVSGFCLLDDRFPIICVNNKTSFSRQCFTLFHELAHILSGTYGITIRDDSYIDSLTGSSRSIEIFCNHFAAEFLVPNSDFTRHIRGSVPDDDTVEELATLYSVSREVILRKLLDRGLVSPEVYQTRSRSYMKDYLRHARESGGNYYATQAAYLGRAYLKLAYGKYYGGECSIEQLADHLNVKTASISELERYALQ
jgi:Zn-dependent peptidase ImmA (M78 family)